MALEEVWNVVRSIPLGRVASYGAIGRALRPPLSGRIVGRFMARCPGDVPWWRVVAQTGELPVGKRDPRLEMEQREILAGEGVPMTQGVVAPEAFWEP
ncbi:MAG: MGMT family protein [Fimbriimonadaceae bacterium]|nr:MGMT family protein [Fimbriimonadaceae bacterium]QYK58865.1 MAG: MGMT family protein [Fimbriimonadaceae bacterium]